MANEVYINKGTALLVNGEAGANVAFSVENVANAAGRVSAQIDLGVLPRPALFEWSCEVMFQATPTAGRALELFIATAPDQDATQIDADVGNADAALAASSMRYNLRKIGAVVAESATAGEKFVASGVFECTQRYLSIVAYNDSGAAVNATDSNFRFDLRPIFWQGQ